MVSYPKIEDLFSKEDIDIYDYMLISLHSGYADYCYSKRQVRILINRIRKYMGDSALISKVTDEDGIYFHILPIKIYKRYDGTPKLVRGMSIGSDKIPNGYRIIFEGSEEFPSNIILKDFDKPICMDTLNNVIKMTNEQNY